MEVSGTLLCANVNTQSSSLARTKMTATTLINSKLIHKRRHLGFNPLRYHLVIINHLRLLMIRKMILSKRDQAMNMIPSLKREILMNYPDIYRRWLMSSQRSKQWTNELVSWLEQPLWELLSLLTWLLIIFSPGKTTKTVSGRTSTQWIDSGLRMWRRWLLSGAQTSWLGTYTNLNRKEFLIWWQSPN